jgi:hypothetical protein
MFLSATSTLILNVIKADTTSQSLVTFFLFASYTALVFNHGYEKAAKGLKETQRQAEKNREPVGLEKRVDVGKGARAAVEPGED